MKTYETVARIITEKRTVSCTCDLCGKKATRPGRDWSDSIYNIDDVEVSITVKHKDGSNYPEGGMGTETKVDMCPDCFKNKLVPWLQAQGVKVETKDWDG